MSEIIDKDVKTREVWRKAIAHFKKIGEEIQSEVMKVFLKAKTFNLSVIRGMICVEDISSVVKQDRKNI